VACLCRGRFCTGQCAGCAPGDSFEVALLDDNTGASVLSGDGLTRSDAFLNLQADGAQHAASTLRPKNIRTCVTCLSRK
jgi:hypothetical protein